MAVPMLQKLEHFLMVTTTTTTTTLILFHLTLNNSETDVKYLDHRCLENAANSSTYQANLNSVLSALAVDTTIDYGFYNFSAGNATDAAYSIALCRGDLSTDTCRSCINETSHEILQRCPDHKVAILWYDLCMLRFSDTPMFGTLTYDPDLLQYSSAYVQDGSGFEDVLGGLLLRLSSAAAAGNSTLKFASSYAGLSRLVNLYALVQCTPDLSLSDCSSCLERARLVLPGPCCDRKRGARYYYPSCYLRFEDFKFYASMPTLLPSPPKGEESNKSRKAAIIAAPIIVGLILVALTTFFLVRRRKQLRELADVDDQLGREESLQFEFGVIRAATDDFSDANKLGQGGFGAVYKGTLSDGREIAVKRLSMNSGQGEMEFKNEVLLVAKLQHRNLVRLLGFSFQGDERLLIYEFLPNASLDHFIFHPVKRLLLDWEARYRILVGIARGLQYLHEDSRLRIIHRDLKAANVLLDGDMNAKITDFGIARLVEMDQTQANTSKVVGTYGYMAPEYALHGIFSVRSDVFSFGVLALEIMSGRKSYSFTNEEDSEDLLTFAWKNWKEGTASNVIDPALMDGLMAKEITKYLNVALICVQENAEHRPTMASVVVMLSTNDITLPVPVRPASYIPSRTGEADPLLQVTNSSSSNELTDSLQGCPR